MIFIVAVYQPQLYSTHDRTSVCLSVCVHDYLPWWLSYLDRGALNNVDAPGCGTSVVRGPTGHK